MSELSDLLHIVIVGGLGLLAGPRAATAARPVLEGLGHTVPKLLGLNLINPKPPT